MRKARDKAVLDPELEASPAFQHGQEHPAEEEKRLSRRRQLEEIQRMETCFKDGIIEYMRYFREG